MNEGRISIRYAGALYDMAFKQKSEQQVYQQLIVLTQAFFTVPELVEALSNPTYSKKQKLDLLITASGKNAPEALITFFEFVLSKGREPFMLFICMSYQDLYRKEQKMVVGELISAVEVSAKTIKKMTDFVQKKYNQQLDLITKIDPSIIGGFIFEVNNQRIDASIKAELRKIERSLSA